MSGGAEQAYPLVFSPDSPMIPVYRTLARIREEPTPVLIEGETGSGKDGLALWLHYNSPRRQAPFIKVDFSSLPGEFVEPELFGYEDPPTLGKLELAQRGTAVLEEIASMDFRVQAKLLNVFEGNQFYRLGGSKEIQLDARIVGLSRTPLAHAVDRQGFRQDLFFRLNQITVRIPPLRERRNEILPIATFLVEQLNGKYKRSSNVHPECRAVFEQYAFPGNIRELQDALKAALLMGPGREITPEALPPSWFLQPRSINNPRSLEEMERHHIAEVLRQEHGRKVKAAEILGISRKTLLEKRKKYGLE